jgi:YndJ-like protein
MKEPWSEPTMTRTNALLFLLWCAIAAAALTRHTWLGPIEVLFLLAPLVHVPLGLRVVRKLQAEFSPFGRLANRLLPIGAIAAAVSFWPHTGLSAGFLASGWFFVCSLFAAEGILLFFRGGYRSAESICISVGLAYLAVGGVWLVLSRSGVTPMHFAEPIILLTAVHFHFTGFALPVVTAATGRALANRASRGVAASLFPYVAVGIVSGPAILAGGFVFGYPLWKLLAALFLATICIVLAAQLFSVVPRIEPRSAQVLLCVSAASLIIGMVLAGAYVVGDFTQRFWLLIPRMARLHGTTNALGFAFCGLLGWAIAYGAIQRPASPSVDSATHSIGPYGAPGRTVAAFLIAPLIVPVVLSAPILVPDAYNLRIFSPWELLDQFSTLTFFSLPSAYFAELVLGVPAWLAFKYFRIRSFISFAAGGAFVGLLFYAIWEGWVLNLTLHSLAQEFDPFGLAIFVIPASASAILFRAIAFSKPKKLLSS